MDDPKFYPCDVAWLKSSGPAMVVVGKAESTDDENYVHCVWFDKNHQRQEGDFSKGWLVKTDPWHVSAS